MEARFQPLHSERVRFCFWKPSGLQQPQRTNTVTKPGGHPSPTPDKSIFCCPGTREGVRQSRASAQDRQGWEATYSKQTGHLEAGQPRVFPDPELASKLTEQHPRLSALVKARDGEAEAEAKQTTECHRPGSATLGEATLQNSSPSKSQARAAAQAASTCSGHGNGLWRQTHGFESPP